MTNEQALIEALRQDGIEPTPDDIARLDNQITALAELLIAYWIERKNYHIPEGTGISDQHAAEQLDFKLPASNSS